jgi:prepilin-type N-terminal cleavage/methylation domain-containing protein
MHRLRSPKRLLNAFTILELLVVLIVVGILVSISFPVYGTMMGKARQRDVEATALNVGRAATLTIADAQGGVAAAYEAAEAYVLAATSEGKVTCQLSAEEGDQQNHFVTCVHTRDAARTATYSSARGGLVLSGGGGGGGDNGSGGGGDPVAFGAAGWYLHETALSTPRAMHATAQGPNGSLYAIGGVTNGPVATNSVEVYDSGDDYWFPAATLPSARWGHGAHAASDGQGGVAIYVAGGVNSSGIPQTSVFRLSLDAGTWSTVAPLPEARSGPGLVSSGSFLYVIGGNDPFGGGELDSVQRYHPGTNSWSPVASLNQPRAHSAVARDGTGRIYAVGGWSGQSSLEMYHPSTDSWTELSAPPVALGEGHSAAFGPDDKLYVLVGNDGGSTSSRVLIYDPSTDTWSEGPALTTPRYGATLTRSGNALVVVGGVNGSTYLTTYERLDYRPPE